jgi:hypothetical protein
MTNFTCARRRASIASKGSFQSDQAWSEKGVEKGSGSACQSDKSRVHLREVVDHEVRYLVTTVAQKKGLAEFGWSSSPLLESAVRNVRRNRPTKYKQPGPWMPQNHPHPKDEPIPKPPPLRLSKAGAPGTERKTPFQVPNGWIWTRLGQVGELVNGDRSKNYPNKADYASKFNKSSPCRRQSTTKSSSVRRSKSDVTNVLSVSMSACASGKA